MVAPPLRVLVLTCNSYLWAVRPFSLLFNTFWSSLQPVIVGGFALPTFPLPDNFEFFQIDKRDYPKNRWSDALIRMLEVIKDEYFVLLLEDYWLCRGVDHGGVLTLYEYMRAHPEIVRLDLTADRLYGHMMHDVEPYGHYDIIECAEDAPYQMSLQAAIWKRELLLQLLERGKSAWEVEIHTNMIGRNMRVVGSRQWPVRYANAVYQGRLDLEQIGRIPEPQKSEVLKMIPEGMEKRKQ